MAGPDDESSRLDALMHEAEDEGRPAAGQRYTREQFQWDGIVRQYEALADRILP